MRCDCNRCLEPADFPIDSSFDLFYRPAEAAGDGEEEVEIDEGEAEIAFYEGAGIDLKDVLREQVLLSYADAARLPRRLPGDLSGMRTKSEPGTLRMRSQTRGRSLVRAQETSSERKLKYSLKGTQDAESETTTLQAAHLHAPGS